MKSIRDVSKPNSANGICCTIKKNKKKIQEIQLLVMNPSLS